MTDQAAGLVFVFHCLPCRHEDAGMPHDGPVSDYEPMSRDQVTMLLDEAASVQGDWQAVSRLQCRLGRALPGVTCPSEVDGPVAERAARLACLFTGRYREGGTAELTGAVWSILTEQLRELADPDDECDGAGRDR